jgi:hypothetical protein
MYKMATKQWIAVLEIAMEAVYQKDGGMAANETGWRNDELREAWLAIHGEITRLENEP